jgi:long-chain acyl-CoA synthetase
VNVIDKLTLKHVLETGCERNPESTALGWVDGHSFSYSELVQHVRGLSHLLSEKGVTRGDKVAILGESMPNWGVAYFAVTTMGAVAVPILPEFHPSAVHHILRHSDAKAVFVSRRLLDKLDNLDILPELLVIILDDFSLLEADSTMDRLRDGLRSGIKEVRNLKERALRFAGRQPQVVEEDDLAAIIYTSGTTGSSKGVMLTHKNIVFNALQTVNLVNAQPGDRMLSILPLSHTYECTLGLVLPIMSGCSVHYMDKPPTAKVLLPAMKKVKPTIMLSVPLVIEKIYRMRILPQLTASWVKRRLYRIPAVRKKMHRLAGRKLLDSFGGELRILAIGGALLDPGVEEFLLEAGFPYSIGYGLTETSPLISGATPAGHRYRSAGKVLPGVEATIMDPGPETGEGEILVRGSSVMKGYHKAPEVTNKVFTDEGWLMTGDLGFIDKDGYMFIKGRRTNMIVGPSGENIYPEEIEYVLNSNAFVLESLAYEREGQLVGRVHLNYDLLDERLADDGLSESQARRKVEELLEDIRREANEQLSSFSRLKRVIEQPEPFEKTPTQKIKRYLYTD